MLNKKAKKTNSSGFSWALKLPKFSAKTIFILLQIVLVIIQVFNGYEVYQLFDKTLYLFENLSDVKMEITNYSFLSEMYVAVHESQPQLFSNNKVLKATAIGSKKLPIILLYIFFVLVLLNFIYVLDFDIKHYLLIGLIHITIHIVVHFLQKDKKQKWYKCICYINSCRRFWKRKFNKSKIK